MHKESGEIRHEWVCELAEMCDAFVVRVNESDRDDFSAAASAFGSSLPAPVSRAELMLLCERVFACAIQAGIDFHRQYHRKLRVPCAHSPVESATALLQPLHEPATTISLAPLVDRWAREYISVFDRHHIWPPAVRAAAILRHNGHQRQPLAALARRVGSSRSALTRDFKSFYGISVGEYDLRARMAQAVFSLRAPDSNVEAVALEAGFRSLKNFYLAVRKLTGLTPRRIRELPASAVDGLVRERFILPGWRSPFH